MFPSLTLTLLLSCILLYVLLCVISFTCGSLSESHSGCSRVLALDGYLQHGGVPFCKVRAVNSSQFSVLTLDYFYFYSIFSSFPSVHNFYFSVSLSSYFKSIFDLNFNHLSCLFSFLNFHINPSTLLSSLANFSRFFQACFPIFSKDPNFRGVSTNPRDFGITAPRVWKAPGKPFFPWK